MNCPTVLHAAVSLHRLVTYIFPLNNVFFDETNSFYCVTVYFSVENCECSKVPLTGPKVPPGWGSFE